MFSQSLLFYLHPSLFPDEYTWASEHDKLTKYVSFDAARDMCCCIFLVSNQRLITTKKM